MTNELDLATLKKAVTGTAAAFRSITDYQPMGGPGDKVFPPTYEDGKYAVEQRILPIYSDPVTCVLLNSVQSEANRMEIALLDAWEDQRISLPVITVDFSAADLPTNLRITSLEAPHRIADALLRDSELNGVKFRQTDQGRQLDYVDLKHATPLFELCPTALLFGMWDSTGPRGGLGAKFARALVSEIIGVNAQDGVKTSSRLDPAQIMRQAGPLFQRADGGWTLDPDQALQGKKGPTKLGKDGKPSEANHGNVTPSIADGGFTIETARQTTVLSLPALRRLRFPIAGQAPSPTVDAAARTVLAALGLLAATLTREAGADLRSRCQLFPTGPFFWELLDRPGAPPQSLALSADQAVALFNEALSEATEQGLPWMDEELVLSASPELGDLVRHSQQLAASTTADDGDA